MKIFIKYMVTRRCKLIVQATLNHLGLAYNVIEIGEVELKEDMTANQQDQLRISLLAVGLELMENKKAILVEKIKNLILDIVQNTEQPRKLKNSHYISQELDYDYNYLSNLFSEMTGTTIEQYLIVQRIEKVKELLLYDEQSLKDIAYELNYSSTAHLSNQFKKVTGLTPSFFKNLRSQYLKTQHDEIRYFDQLSESFSWSLSGRQRHYYHQSLHKGCILVLTNLEKTILWASRSFWVMTGYKPIDILGKTPHFLQGPSTDPIVLRFIRKQLNEIQAVETDVLNYRSDGKHYICHLQIEPLRKELGEVTHFLAVEYDVQSK
jgi:PAS domain S-box-containing protein